MRRPLDGACILLSVKIVTLLFQPLPIFNDGWLQRVQIAYSTIYITYPQKSQQFLQHFIAFVSSSNGHTKQFLAFLLRVEPVEYDGIRTEGGELLNAALYVPCPISKVIKADFGLYPHFLRSFPVRAELRSAP